jgi:hypothetical protein
MTLGVKINFTTKKERINLSYTQEAAKLIRITLIRITIN